MYAYLVVEDSEVGEAGQGSGLEKLVVGLKGQDNAVLNETEIRRERGRCYRSPIFSYMHR